MEKLKQLVCARIDEQAQEVIALVKSIESEAELGYKEQKTAAKIASFFAKQGLPYQTGLALTGVKASIGAGDINVAILGELDAVLCADSPKADPNTGAAHACGHAVQLGALLAVATAFNEGIMQELAGRITFMAVPAEEYVEIAYRNALREQGKIKYLGGKQELIRLGEFDDVDMAMMIHSEKNQPANSVSIGKSSNGFIGKTIQYIGETSHAAESPDLGVNALNAAMLGLMGIHAMRETFRDADAIRVHPIITKGGDLVNSVPADVRLETYVRAKTMQAIDATHEKVDRALQAGAMAVGAKVVIKTTPGYLPLISNLKMNKLFVENAKVAAPDMQVFERDHFAASLDMGDVSHLMPVIHPFTGGVTGELHSKDFCVVDYYKACIVPAKTLAMTVIDLLANEAITAKEVLKDFKPVFTKEEYIKKLDSYFSCKE